MLRHQISPFLTLDGKLVEGRFPSEYRAKEPPVSHALLGIFTAFAAKTWFISIILLSRFLILKGAKAASELREQDEDCVSYKKTVNNSKPLHSTFEIKKKAKYFDHFTGEVFMCICVLI